MADRVKTFGESMLGLTTTCSKCHDHKYDPETLARISAYETAYRLQSSVPELTNLKDKLDSTLELYGKESRRPGFYAANCLLARRLDLQKLHPPGQVQGHPGGLWSLRNCPLKSTRY